MEIVYAIVIVLALLCGWLIVTYNRFIRLRSCVEEAWSDIEVQMKRRYDLIPNLVQSVKAYASHEEGVFTKVTQARSAAMQAHSLPEHAQAENMLTQSLKSLFAVAENYPSLQAAGNFLHLQHELSDAEDKIQASRRFYNGMTRDYNIALQSFPSNLIAGPFRFSKKDFFDAPNEAEETPKVTF
jgi:LemA protein